MHQRRGRVVEPLPVVDAHHEPALARRLDQRPAGTREQLGLRRRDALRRQQRRERAERDRRRRPRGPHPPDRAVLGLGQAGGLDRQPRLADAGRARHHDAARRPVGEKRADGVELSVATHQRPCHALSLSHAPASRARIRTRRAWTRAGRSVPSAAPDAATRRPPDPEHARQGGSCVVVRRASDVHAQRLARLADRLLMDPSAQHRGRASRTALDPRDHHREDPRVGRPLRRAALLRRLEPVAGALARAGLARRALPRRRLAVDQRREAPVRRELRRGRPRRRARAAPAGAAAPGGRCRAAGGGAAGAAAPRAASPSCSPRPRTGRRPPRRAPPRSSGGSTPSSGGPCGPRTRRARRAAGRGGRASARAGPGARASACPWPSGRRSVVAAERVEELVADGEARLRAALDQAGAASREAVDARLAQRAAEARAADAVARAAAAERLGAAARAELASAGTGAAWQAAHVAEARAAAAERLARELAVAGLRRAAAADRGRARAPARGRPVGPDRGGRGAPLARPRAGHGRRRRPRGRAHRARLRGGPLARPALKGRSRRRARQSSPPPATMRASSERERMPSLR